MTRNRDIAKFLGKTETANTSNLGLVNSGENVGLDSAQITTIAEGQGLASYTTLDSLPVTGLTAGDQAFVESDQRLYISNGSGWYNVALINATPTLTLDQSGTIQLNADTLTITVTATATDSDDNLDIITFSVESDGNMVGTGTTVSQDSSVFTITADSQGGNGVAGDFTLTFKATDNINVDTEALSFSLTFGNVIDSSAETAILLKANGNGLDDNAMTYEDSNGTSQDFTEGGTPQANTFTPYRSGGYSVYFDGSSDYLSLSSNSSFDPETGDFSIEAWVYNQSTDTSNSKFIASNRSGGSGGWVLAATAVSSSTYEFVFIGYSSGGTTRITITTSDDYNLNQWYHVAAVKSGTTWTIYVDGVSAVSGSQSGNFSAGAALWVGGDSTNNSRYWNGYIRDLRIVKGTAVYTSAFTPPTEALTAIANTSLLACHLPYFADGSTNDHTITANGNVSTKPFGPYDFEPWVADDHGGSVYFDGNNDALATANNVIPSFGTGDFTWEMWFYALALPATDSILIETRDAASSDAGFVLFVDDGYLRSYGNGAYRNPGTGSVVRTYQWNHVAFVRSSGTLKIYLNGKEDTSVSYTGEVDVPTRVRIGSRWDSLVNDWDGHIADVRMTKDAVYTADFTPPTSPVAANSATKLLMNNKSDANIYDATAANRFRIVGAVDSSTTQRKFSTSSSIYHSGGQSKGIEIPSFTSLDGVNRDLTIGTQDFTVECWARFNTVAGGVQALATQAAGSGFTNGNDLQGFWMGLNGANSYFLTQASASSWSTVQQGSSDVSANTWHHFAISRTGGTVRQFLDGSLVGSSYSNSFSMTNTNNLVALMGRNRNSQYFDGGYIQDFRFTIGHSRYTTDSFTPPTAEFEL